MARFVKGLGQAKQWMMQKVGKAEASEEDPDFLALVAQFKTLRNGFTAVKKAAVAYHATQAKLVKEGRELGEALDQIGADTNSTVGPILGLLGTAESSVSQFREESNDKVQQAFVLPISLLVDNEIASAEKGKTAYKRAKLHMDNLGSSIAKAKAKGEVGPQLQLKESQFVDARQTVDTAKVQFTAAVHALQAKRDGEFRELIQQYASVNVQLFEQSRDAFAAADVLEAKETRSAEPVYAPEQQQQQQFQQQQFQQQQFQQQQWEEPAADPAAAAGASGGVYIPETEGGVAPSEGQQPY